MPFKSEKQRRYMHANLPDIAKRWERDYSNGGIAELNQELNSLPAYYLPKNQGGRIGYKGGLKVWGKSVDEQWDNLNEDQKKYIRENFPDQVPEEAAQGGLIPAHQAGIYGLEEGGRVRYFTGAYGGEGAGRGRDDPPDRGPPGGGDPGMTYTAPPEAKPPQLGGPSTVEDAIKFRDTPPEVITGDVDGKITIDELYRSNKPKNTRAQLLLGKLKAKYPNFFQLDTAKKINQIKNMSWKDALNLEKQMSKSLFGKGFTGADKVGGGKYITEGIKSLFMDPSKWSSKIGGATPLAKKLALLTGEKILPAVMGGANILSAPLAYVQGASMLQNFLESQGMAKGALSDDILGKGAMGAGADVLSVPTDIYESSQDVPQIESKEGGIIGLKQGGQLVKPGPGRQGYQGWDPGAGAPQATETQSAPPDRGPPGGGDPGMTYTAPHVPHYKEEEETKKFAIQEDIRRREEEKGGEEYYGLRDLQIKQKDLQTNIKEKIEGDWQRYIDPSIWDTVKNLYAMSNFTGLVKEIFKGIKRTGDMNAFMQDLKDLGLAGGAPGTNDPLYDQLWLHLEKQKGKYRYDDEGGPEGPEVPQETETGITYDDMEDTNRKERASAEARQIQEKVDRSKQDAYYAAFRQQYLMGPTAMAAGGGRVPQGYNTGGLSNLFKLKNV